ncbi:MAG TPA: asparagine synthase-related protein [Terracidiphilus sp.]
MPRAQACRQLEGMVEAVRHESFYTTKTSVDEGAGVYVGCVARENSFSDGMPIQNETGDIVLAFSGEVYTDPSEMRALRERGHAFEDYGASYLVHLYEEDRSFPKCLNGRFHGLVTEPRSHSAMLFNDRYGMQRLYIHEALDAFYFAAEAKAILAIRPELRKPSRQGLGEFVSCGSVLENRTLFDGIQVLPPGSAWKFCRGVLEKKDKYFDPAEWEQQTTLGPEEYHGQIREIFERNFPHYLDGRERMGVSLTGGLDTRTVMAWQKFPPKSLPCYTYGEEKRNCRDIVVAQQVAQTCRQPHQVLRLGGDFFSRFAHYAERSMYLADGCVDVTRAPDLYFSEKAREIAPVRLTGLYGDEILRPQFRAFKPMRFNREVFDADFYPWIDRAQSTYSELIRVHPESFAAFRQAPWHHYGILALEQTQLTVRTPFLDNHLVQTVYRAPTSATENNDFRVRLIGDGSPSLQEIRTDRGFGGKSGPISSWFWQNYLQFTFRTEYAYDYGMPQWLARIDHALSPLGLERMFLGRHKIYHYRTWYRDALSEFVGDMLFSSTSLSRPWVVPGKVRSMVSSHLKGNRNYTMEIHRLLSMELLHRLFFD